MKVKITLIVGVIILALAIFLYGNQTTSRVTTPYPAVSNVTQGFNQTAMLERGNVAMGFNQTKIHHHFMASTTGGEIMIMSTNMSDTQTIIQIKNHVKEIQYEFSQGNFTKPFYIHAQIVPGTEIMTAKKDLIHYSIKDVDGGSVLILTTNDTELLAAIQQFMNFQSSQHMNH